MQKKQQGGNKPESSGSSANLNANPMEDMSAMRYDHCPVLQVIESLKQDLMAKMEENMTTQLAELCNQAAQVVVPWNKLIKESRLSSAR